MQITTGLFTSDAAILRHAVHGLRSIVAPPKASGFTYVTQSLWPMLVILLIVGIPPDFFVRHLLVPKRYELANVAVDFAALVSTLWLCGLFGSMAVRPHEVGDDAVRFHLGLFATIDCHPNELAAVAALGQPARRALRAAGRDAAFLTVPGGNVVRVDFAAPVPVRKYPLLGQRSVRCAFVASDRPAELVAELERVRDAARARA